MPVIVTDFQWKQTEQKVMIKAPLKGIHHSKVDTFISRKFIKATYGHNYLEIILYSAIDLELSSVTLTSTEIVFDLKKADERFWTSLEPNLTKTEKFALKRELLEEAYREEQTIDKKKSEKKCELKRLAVKKQIDIDSEIKEAISKVKKEEEKLALGDFDEWKEKVTRKLKSSNRPKISSDSPPTQIPKTRTSATTKIDFTPRQFPTPCRESKLEEEHEYLIKQAEARRSTGFVGEDIRPEERNPHFVKAKGDDFLKRKNYLGAISAYTYGIGLSKNFVDFYISRSEAHMAVGNFWRVIEDCSAALELLTPICEANLHERAVCIGRRGQALCRYGKRRQGIEELKYSLRLIDSEGFRRALDEEQRKYSEELEAEKKNKQDPIDNCR
ncbi:dynein axonemal assembly factor 4-like [Diorhabda sublineata]|uniref:dynein axonemal assembly factor 4-like n=1 Tax=Diorhabda sublineata TaxID=1163346 RepID=UPI0024E0958D|nr:dynein axonemal assembly factor 4-like [Diorhabda sublineata]